jgi:hypothetical protein
MARGGPRAKPNRVLGDASHTDNVEKANYLNQNQACLSSGKTLEKPGGMPGFVFAREIIQEVRIGKEGELVCQRAVV